MSQRRSSGQAAATATAAASSAPPVRSSLAKSAQAEAALLPARPTSPSVSAQSSPLRRILAEGSAEKRRSSSESSAHRRSLVGERLAEAAYVQSQAASKSALKKDAAHRLSTGSGVVAAEGAADDEMPPWKKELLSRRRSSRFSNPALSDKTEAAAAGPVAEGRPAEQPQVAADVEEASPEPAWKQQLRSRSRKSRTALTAVFAGGTEDKVCARAPPSRVVLAVVVPS